MIDVSIQVLQRTIWNGDPRKQGELFILKKGKRTATCELWSHQFGWELRLQLPDDDMPRTQVCRTQDDVFTTFETWKAALIEKGWA